MASTVASGSSTPDLMEAEKWKEAGNSLYRERKFEDALECYDKALSLNSSEILYLNNKAAVYLEQGNYDLCLSTCQEALDKRYQVKADYSKVAKIYNRMAVCYKKMQNLPKAIDMYNKSLTEDNNRQTRAALKELERENEKQKADAYVDPELSTVHREKGNDFFREKNYPAAKLEYDEAVKRNPKDPRLYANRAACYMHLLEYPMALKDCEKCLDLDPTFIKAHIRKGQILHSMKDYNKAMTAYQKGLELQPDNDELRQGFQKTVAAVSETQRSDKIDNEQVERAMADPEIQNILADPQFRLILQQVSENPKMLPSLLQDTKVAAGLQKLMAAGILRIM